MQVKSSWVRTTRLLPTRLACITKNWFKDGAYLYRSIFVQFMTMQGKQIGDSGAFF